MNSLSFQKTLDTTSIPKDWELVRLSLDWTGQPLLLFREGKPPQPDFRTNTAAWSAWYQTPPKAHHLVYQESSNPQFITLDHSQSLSTFHVQRFAEGWLLADSRGGKATLYDKRGAVRSTLDLGDASEDIQTTADGQIWVSYFDEGVFGNGIGRQGLVCFNSVGEPLFKYADFAEQNALPFICDCYAMNVDQEGAVWANYYTDFPLVRLKNFKLEKVWNSFGVLGKTFAVRGNQIIHHREGQFAVRDITELSTNPVTMQAIDEDGRVLAYGDITARGAFFAIKTSDAVHATLGS